jgi:prevent-host-death family protein
MPTYSIAQAKDQLSRLVDEALAGKQVTITRHGKPVAELRPAGHAPRPTNKADILWLRKRRQALPALGGDAVSIVRGIRDEPE